MKPQYLLTPGPTPVPPDALAEMGRPIIHHRTPEFQAILSEVVEDLHYVFQTAHDVLLFAASGTGAMESACANLLSPGDEALVVQGGKFGERWGEILKAYGAKAHVMNVPWGQAAPPQEIANALRARPAMKAVFTTLCETSTGAIYPIQEIGRVVAATPAVLVVDAISGLGVVELETDRWQVDVVVAGSQKGLMIPPGLAFVSVSPKAWRLVEQSRLPKYYFSWTLAKNAMQKRDTPFTPAISLIRGLHRTLKMIRQEGLEAIMARNRQLAEAARQACQALGLKIYTAPEATGAAVTAIQVPEGVAGEELVKRMRQEHGVWIAEGQAELKGKIFRIASMGYINAFDLLTAISSLELALTQLGHPVDIGTGVRAALQVLANRPPASRSSGRAGPPARRASRQAGPPAARSSGRAGAGKAHIAHR